MSFSAAGGEGSLIACSNSGTQDTYRRLIIVYALQKVEMNAYSELPDVKVCVKAVDANGKGDDELKVRYACLGEAIYHMHSSAKASLLALCHGERLRCE